MKDNYQGKQPKQVEDSEALIAFAAVGLICTLLGILITKLLS